MLTLLAIAQQPATPGRGLLPTVLMFGSMMAIFYFLLLRPQSKVRQRHAAMIAGLKKGDEVMTDGGIIGQIVHVAEDRLTVRTAENTRIVVSRDKINRVLSSDTTTESKP